VQFAGQGFVDLTHNRSPHRLTLNPDQQLTGLTVALTRTAAISGRVLDQNQKPLSAAIVVAVRPTYVNGKRTLIPHLRTTRVSYDPVGRQSQPVRQFKANERGEFRVYDLEPGEYYLIVIGENMPGTTPPIYYPGVLDPAVAAPIMLRGDVSGMDIRIPSQELQAARFNITLTTTPPYDCSLVNNPRIGRITQFLLLRHAQDLDVVYFSTFQDEAVMGFQNLGAGQWRTPKLPAGSYELFVSPCAEALLGTVGHMSFVIPDRDSDIGTLIVPANLPLTGRVRSTTGSAIPLDKIKIRLRPSDARGFGGTSMNPNPTTKPYFSVAADGTFAIEAGGIPRTAPGHYRIDVSELPPNVYVASIRYQGQEVRDTGIDAAGEGGVLDITLGAPGGSITGTVRDNQDRPTSSSTVVVIPEAILQGQLTFTRVDQTDQRGDFTFSGLPPGDYRVFAWEYVEPGGYENQEFLKQYVTQGTRIALKNSSAVNVTLRLITR
jgi:hypothetical protein